MIEEKDRLTDALITEKYMADIYNVSALEASNSQLKDTFMNILRDVHQIQYEIYQEMNHRGWYQPKAANTSDISQHLNKWNQDLHRIQSSITRQAGQAQQTGPQPGYQGSFYAGPPQYGMHPGTGVPQTGQQQSGQTMYRPPQQPLS